MYVMVQNGNPELAGKWLLPSIKSPDGKARIDAALANWNLIPQVDTEQIAAIGYCFGAVVLNVARLGEDLKEGVVEIFTGNLVGVPAKKNCWKPKVLVC